MNLIQAIAALETPARDLASAFLGAAGFQIDFRSTMKSSAKILILCFTLLIICFAIRGIVIAGIYRYMQVEAASLGEDAPAYVRSWSMYFAILQQRAKSISNWVIALWSFGLMIPALRKSCRHYSIALGLGVFLTEVWVESFLFPAILTPLFAGSALPFMAILMIKWLNLNEEHV